MRYGARYEEFGWRLLSESLGLWFLMEIIAVWTETLKLCFELFSTTVNVNTILAFES